MYDAANRLQSVNGETYTFDANGNLLVTGVMTNTWDAANRLVESRRDGATVQPIYNGLGDRVGQTVAGVQTDFALDVAGGLPEVIYTSDDNAYLHLPGVIVAESKAGETRYLLSDGLGSVRQAVDDSGAVTAYNEFDPYGNPTQNSALSTQNYGFTGEWWQAEVGLLHLRARWYSVETGTFLSRDSVEGEPAYQYVRGNVVNRTDGSGNAPECESSKCKVELLSLRVQAGGGILGFSGHLSIVFTNYNEDIYTVEGMPENNPFSGDPGSLIMFGPFEDQNDPVVTLPGQYRETGANGATFITLAEGEGKEVCGQWKCLKGKLQDIMSMNIPYNPLGPNSNTAVYSAVKACGLPTSGPQYDVGMWRTHVGWGIDLFDPKPVPVPTPPGTPATPTSPNPPISPPRPSPSATPTRAGT